MNLTRQDLSVRMALAMRISDTEWVLPDLAQFAAVLPGRGDKDVGVPQRLRAHLDLNRSPQKPHRVGTMTLDRCPELGCAIARLKLYTPKSDRYAWRRFPLDVERATLIAVAAEVHPGPVSVIVHGESEPPAAPATPPAPQAPAAGFEPAPRPARAPRSASTSVGRMPDPELLRLYADAGDELGVRGLLPPVQVPAPPPVKMSAQALTDEEVVRELSGRLAKMSEDLVRRTCADTTAERARRLEALQAKIAALG